MTGRDNPLEASSGLSQKGRAFAMQRVWTESILLGKETAAK
jgi:hypothetical protein